MILPSDVEKVLIKSNIRPALLFARGSGWGRLSPFSGRREGRFAHLRGSGCPSHLPGVSRHVLRPSPLERGAGPLREGPAWPFRADCSILCLAGRPATGCHRSGPGHGRPEWSWQGLGSPALAFQQPGVRELLGCKGHGSFCGPGRGEHGGSLQSSHWVRSFVSGKWELSPRTSHCIRAWPVTVSGALPRGAPGEPPPLHLLPHHLGGMPEART